MMKAFMTWLIPLVIGLFGGTWLGPEFLGTECDHESESPPIVAPVAD